MRAKPNSNFHSKMVRRSCHFGISWVTWLRVPTNIPRVSRDSSCSRLEHPYLTTSLPFKWGRSSPDLIHKTPPTSKSYFFLPHLTSWPSLTRPCTVTILTNTHHFYILVPLYGPFVTFFLRVKPNPIHSRILYVNVPNPINQLLFVLFTELYVHESKLLSTWISTVFWNCFRYPVLQ